VILHRAVTHARPDVVLLDSDYHFLAFLGRGLRIFFLGQAIDVVHRAKSLGYRPPRWLSWLSFLACEVGDGLVQRCLSHRVFVPSFLETEHESSGARALKVPLIVREEFRRAGERAPSREAVAVTSGSGIEIDRIDGLAGALGAARFSHGHHDVRVTSPEDFQAAEMVVIQGGLTSISECIALRKPMLVVPIRGRAEQEVNARTVERLGLGFSCDDDDWRRARDASRDALRETEGRRARILVHGAEVVARHVFADA
jgi:hypothetical protein